MARLKKEKNGRYQRKVTLSNGKQKFVYGKTIAEVNAAANALMNQDTAGLEVGDHTLVGEWAKIWLKTINPIYGPLPSKCTGIAIISTSWNRSDTWNSET